MENIGYGEYVGGEGLTLIEWADNFLEEMPEESLDIYIKIVPEGRLIQLLPNGERYLELCEEVEKNADFSLIRQLKSVPWVCVVMDKFWRI